jgi:hypothetical protein
MTIWTECEDRIRQEYEINAIVAVITKSLIFAFSWFIFDGTRLIYVILTAYFELNMILAFSCDLNNIKSYLHCDVARVK